MVQSLNIPSILTSIRVFLFERQLACPHFQVKDLRAINFSSLKKAGCKAIVFDKDNCLTAPYETEIFPPLKDAVQNCISTFGQENVAIMSNSAGSSDDKNFEKAIKMEQALKMKVIKHGTKKPDGKKEVLEHFNCSPNEIAMVGDRLLTDVVFGNLCGFLTIHTQELTATNDNSAAYVMRRVENWLVKINFFNPRMTLKHPLSKADIELIKQ